MENVDMSVPVDDFDFFLSLDDVDTAFSPETRKTLKAEQETHKANVHAQRAENESFDFLNDDSDSDDSIEWEDPFKDAKIDKDFLFGDELPDEEETETQPEHEEGEVAENLSGEEVDQETLDEAYDVDYDTVITLPNGVITTIEDLTKFAQSGEEFERKAQEIAKREADLEARITASKDLISASTLELDNLLADYANFDWDALGASDPQAHYEHQKYVRGLEQRRSQILAQKAALEAEAEQAKAEKFKKDASHCVKTLKAEIPEWSDPLYENLMEYAVNNGADRDGIYVEVNPVFWKMVHKAYKADKGLGEVRAKLEKIKGKGMRKVLTPNAGQPMTGRKEAEQREAAARYAAGKMSNADAFKFLED